MKELTFEEGVKQLREKLGRDPTIQDIFEDIMERSRNE